MGIVATEEHTGEIWLYVPRRAQKVTVKHPNFGVLRDYFYAAPIEGGRTYEMLIDIGTGRYVTITSEVAGSDIYVDGVSAGSDIYVDGVSAGKSPLYNQYLNYGRHTIAARKNRYEGEAAVFVTTNDDAAATRVISIAQRDMSDHFGDVVVTVDNKADLYFDDHKVGTGTWKTQLREGSYVVEARKADCDPVKTSFTVVARQKNAIKANVPVPHTGWLSIYTRPGNVQTTYNGSHFIDLSETVSVPIGTYQMRFARKGYVTQDHEYVVRHNQTTSDTVTLTRINYIKPTHFYFGAAYTLRSLSGLTGIVGFTFKRHDLQASYTIGMEETKRTNWSDSEGNYLGASKHKMNSFAVKYGYQIHLINRLALVPQVGYAMNVINSSIVDGSTSYADGATASYATVGAKLLYAPIQHGMLYVAPEYDVALSNDAYFKAVSSKAGFSISGFLLNAGVLISF